MKNLTNPEVNVVPSSSLVQHGDLPALLVLVEQFGRVVAQVLRDEGLVVAEEVPGHEVAVRSAADGRVEDQRVVVHAVNGGITVCEKNNLDKNLYEIIYYDITRF